MKNIFFNIKKVTFAINEILISKLIIFKIEKHFKKQIGPLKLQKLLWFFYIYFYKEKEYSFFESDFEAWEYGPVNYKVWKYFNTSMLSLKYKNIPNIVEITENEKKLFKFIEDDLYGEDLENWMLINKILEKTLNKKMKYSSLELYKQTHKLTIWKNTKKNEKIKIDKKNIKSIFDECFETDEYDW